jgi:hypothetical protein
VGQVTAEPSVKAYMHTPRRRRTIVRPEGCSSRDVARQLELAWRPDERSWLTTPSLEDTHLDQGNLELERKMFEATQHNKAQAAAELADKEKQLTDRGIAVLQAPNVRRRGAARRR